MIFNKINRYFNKLTFDSKASPSLQVFEYLIMRIVREFYISEHNFSKIKEL